MQALVATPGVADSLRVAEVTTPKPATGQALVRALAVGVCGTDRSIGAGHFGRAPDGREGLIIGHEVLGVLDEAVPGFSAGTLVAATVRRSCHQCENCAAGEMDSCTTGDFLERGIVGLDGFAAECFVESPENLIAIPASLGAFGVLAEPASIAERGLRHTLAVGQRQGWQPRRALVLGVGALGILSVMLLRLRGIETWAMSRGAADSPRASLVEATGARYTSTADGSLSELAAEIGGFDLILEAAGSPELMVEAVSALAPNGVLCLRGIDTERRELSVASNLFSEEVVLNNKAIVGSTNAAHQDWTRGADDLEAIRRRWPDVLEQVIGARVQPDRFAEALGAQNVKSVIDFS